MIPDEQVRSERHKIILYVCTHQRNEPLRQMLESVKLAALTATSEAEVGVVVVDDNPDGRAAEVVDTFDHDFPLGLHYRHCGAQNISAARNMGVNAAIELGDWVAMTDDDIIVPESWFSELVAVQEETAADCVTGPAYLAFDPSSPRWMREQPFGQVGLFVHPELAIIGEGSTGNSMMRSSFLREFPDVRFEPELGSLGGEDMVFFRRAVDHGLVSRYSRRVAVSEAFPADRSTAAYLFYRSIWIGNTEALTNLRSKKASRPRLAVRSAKRLLAAGTRPFSRLAKSDKPEFHYGAALGTQAVGMMLGVLGIKLRHR